MSWLLSTGGAEAHWYSNPLADIAVVISGLMLLWQIAKELRARREDAEVKLGIAWNGVGVEGSQYWIVEVVNTGPATLYVKSVGMRTDSWTMGWPKPPGATIPGPIEPRDSGFTFRQHEPTNIMPEPEAHAVVRTARKTFTSRPVGSDHPPPIEDSMRFTHLLPRGEAVARAPSRVEE